MAKADHAFRTISEAAEEVGAPQHVLRFWETKFAFVSPLKRAGGRRFYRPGDVALLKAVRRLLHDEGLTIRGVQRLHKEQGLAALAAWADEAHSLKSTAATVTSSNSTAAGGAQRLRAILADLEAARARLDGVLSG